MTQSSLKCLHGKEVKMNATSRINERKNKEFRIIKKNQQLIIWGKKTTKICKFIKDMNINYPLINLQTQLNSNQNPDTDFHGSWQADHEIYIEQQRVKNCQETQRRVWFELAPLWNENRRGEESTEGSKSHVLMCTSVLCIVKCISHWVVIKKNWKTSHNIFLNMWRNMFKNVHSSTTGITTKKLSASKMLTNKKMDSMYL